MEQQYLVLHLKEVLHQLGQYYAAPTDFVRVFGKKIGKPNLHRKLYHDILKGNITFERSEWASCLTVVLNNAQQILKKYQEKFEKLQNSAALERMR